MLHSSFQRPSGPRLARGARRIGGKPVPAGWYTGVRRTSGRSWHAEVNRRRSEGVVYSAAFADTVYGDPHSSLHAAHDWFVRITREHPSSIGQRNGGGSPYDADPPVIHVTARWQWSRGVPWWSEQAEVRYRERGVQRCRSFAFRKHGELEAMSLARHALAEVYGKPYSRSA